MCKGDANELFDEGTILKSITCSNSTLSNFGFSRDNWCAFKTVSDLVVVTYCLALLVTHVNTATEGTC